MKSFNWGSLGTGNIASSMAEAMTLVPEARRAAVASRSHDKAQAFADRWGVAKAYGGYDALMADPEIDIIYIATPNACHKDNILAALGAGKHVLCEKPMTLSEADSAACFDAAEAKGLVLVEALWTAFFPAMRKAVELVQAGTIGTPRHLTATFISHRDPQSHPILFDPALGGGARNDLGIYPLAAALLLAGPVVSNTVKSVFGQSGVDEMTAMILEHENGAMSQLACGFRVELPIALRLSGDNGHLEIAETFHCPQRVSVQVGGAWTHHDLPSLGKGYAHEVMALHDRLSDPQTVRLAWGRAQTLAAANILAH